MEFRPTGGHHSNYDPPPPSHSSGTSYFYQQAMRVGYLHPDLARAGDYYSHPSNVRETVLREIEKQRIREDIIATEIERRRQLEAEVRREMMLEREMAIRGAHTHDLPMLFGSQPMFMNSRLPNLNHSENKFRDPLPFSRRSEVRITEVESTPEVNRDRIILLPKPEGNAFGIKRKAVNPPEASAEMPFADPKKKTLRCEICHVSTTSELSLREHFRGKKHKSKEARQPSHIAGKNFAIGLFSRKASKEPETGEDDGLVPEEKPDDDVADQVVSEKSGKEDGLKFSFWCGMCKIGAFSKKVMNKHMMGKKHMSRSADGSKAVDADKAAVEKEATEVEKQPLVELAGEEKEAEKPLDTDDVAVSSGSEPLRICWLDDV